MVNFISYYRIMSQDKENVSRTSASDAATTAAMTDETLSDAEKLNAITTNIVGTLKEMPKMMADSMKGVADSLIGVVGRLETTVSNMEKYFNTTNGKPQKDKK